MVVAAAYAIEILQRGSRRHARFGFLLPSTRELPRCA